VVLILLMFVLVVNVVSNTGAAQATDAITIWNASTSSSGLGWFSRDICSVALCALQSLAIAFFVWRLAGAASGSTPSGTANGQRSAGPVAEAFTGGTANGQRSAGPVAVHAELDVATLKDLIADCMAAIFVGADSATVELEEAMREAEEEQHAEQDLLCRLRVVAERTQAVSLRAAQLKAEASRPPTAAREGAASSPLAMSHSVVVQFQPPPGLAASMETLSASRAVDMHDINTLREIKDVMVVAAQAAAEEAGATVVRMVEGVRGPVAARSVAEPATVTRAEVVPDSGRSSCSGGSLNGSSPLGPAAPAATAPPRLHADDAAPRDRAGAPVRHQWHQCGTPVAAVPVQRHQPPQQPAAATQLPYWQAAAPVLGHQPPQQPTATVQLPQQPTATVLGHQATAPPPLSWGDPSIFAWDSSQQWYMCTLCGKQVTDWHLTCDKHRKRAAAAAQPLHQAPFPLPSSWGDPSIFSWDSSQQWYRCTLCCKQVTDGHLTCDMHRRKAAAAAPPLWGSFAPLPGPP
jgi:hypothetical protein